LAPAVASAPAKARERIEVAPDAGISKLDYPTGEDTLRSADFVTLGLR
jgi:hypothetical protein